MTHFSLNAYGLLAVVVLAAASGCGNQQPPPRSQPVAVADAVAKAQDAAEPAEPSPPPSPAPVDRAAAPSEPTPPEPTPQRLAVLTPGGPLVVELILTVDGQPFQKPFEAIVAQMVAAADTNDDGRSTWQEWRDNSDFLSSPIANAGQAMARQLGNWVEQYDENSDGQMQPHEAASWLGRNADRGAAAFAVRSRRSFRLAAAASQLWRKLDANEDRRLSSSEINAAPTTLIALDANDNRILEESEVAPLLQQITANNPNSAGDAAGRQRHAAIPLDSRTTADELDFVLSDLYAPRHYLSEKSFPELPELFARLNANGDDWLDKGELARLLTIQPHLSFTVDFDSQRRVSTMTLNHCASPVQASQDELTQRFVITVGTTRLLASAHDLTSEDAEEAELPGSQLRAMVHDRCDRLLVELDRNGDGRLGESELLGCREVLQSLDRNGDGRATPEELPPTMIMAVLRGESMAERNFYVPAISTARTAAALPWFAAADLNNDGDVSRREFLGTLQQFENLDFDGNGFLSVQEAETTSPP